MRLNIWIWNTSNLNLWVLQRQPLLGLSSFCGGCGGAKKLTEKHRENHTRGKLAQAATCAHCGVCECLCVYLVCARVVVAAIIVGLCPFAHAPPTRWWSFVCWCWIHWYGKGFPLARSAVYKAKYNNLGGSVAVGLKLMLAHR